jgi:hypothetical protein
MGAANPEKKERGETKNEEHGTVSGLDGNLQNRNRDGLPGGYILP